MLGTARSAAALLSIALGAVALLVLALASGSEWFGPSRLLRIFTGMESDIRAEIVLGLRLPRALAAFGAGGLLALAGALMQILLRNPLADPYVLGLAGGAGTGALGAMLLAMPPAWTVGGAWLGALASVALVLAFGRARGGGSARDEPLRLLLVGVALATGWGAAITLILALAPDASLRGMLFWLMGDIDGAESFVLPGASLLLLCLAAVLLGRDCNVLLQGAALAHTRGVHVERVRLGIMLVASAATAAAVTTVGPVGFVGLIVPNAVRLVLGNDQRLVMPACALGGGALLVGADTLARTLAAPTQLPVGAVLAALGVPVFVWLVSRAWERR